MFLKQEQVQKLNQSQILRSTLLQMSTVELDAYLTDLAQSNPVVELEEGFSDFSPDNKLLQKLRWLEENDYQNRFYRPAEEEFADPLDRASTSGGLEETLLRFLLRQIDRLNLSPQTAAAARYLAACLDDDGYLRTPVEELANAGVLALPCLKEGLAVLQSLEPAGVGAATLSQCLTLQLERLGESGPVREIVSTYLEPLAKHHYRFIASQMGISLEQVQQCQRLIQQLNPRPGGDFEGCETVGFIQPDVIVTEEQDGFFVQTRRGQQPPFHLNAFYQELLDQSDDPHVLEYLSEKMRQATAILQAVEQRESTLQRCAQAIVDRQHAFFRQGPGGLLPLRMADIAQSLGIHESTVSRAVREKYLQCSMGIFPMSYFFSRSSAAPELSGSGAAARTRLRQLIDQEDKTRPLSDQKLCQLLTQEGYSLSRRTVAKYREEMNIPGTAGRRNME
ncbi:MAG TPA: RNA polymerase factor sigma-54 [Candidatus Faecousia faecavium]|nr:RNA polymerase factor sigma-54 [Candidatus Faecousia faecavium]